ncbi:hypothetical protein HG531_010207 [Fusarium graminearum]|nr:hypothetical protein HG531_010207 [Fusarium graminearum]
MMRINELTDNLECLETIHSIQSKILELCLLQILLLSLHNVGQTCVSRLVESEICSDNHGQLGAHRFDTTVHLLCNSNLVVGAEFDLARLCSLWPSQETRQHLTRLIGIVVDALLAQDHQIALLLFHGLLEKLGHCQRLDFLALLELNVDGTVCAHGHGCS